MSDQEKDRFGEKLHEVEKAREDLFFAERDRQLLEKLKAQTGDQAEETARALSKGNCPRCGERLVNTSRLDVTLDECPRDHGTWLADGELDKLISRESSGWLARVLGRPR